MSFSAIVKNELCRLDYGRECCLRSELAAGLGMNGIVVANQNGISLRITTENAAFARRLYSQIKTLNGTVPEVVIRKSRKLKKHVSYIIIMTPGLGAAQLLEGAGISIGQRADGVELKTDTAEIKKACCRKAFLRGAFLAGGSVSDPEKTYHLEIASHNPEISRYLAAVLASFKLHARIIKRKGSYVTYLKEGENIVDFLNIIGAHKALMELENVRILKDMRNNVNRIVNCETANLEKTVNASVRQINNIRYIMNHAGFGKLPESLKEIAELRLEYTDANLTELGQMLTPPLGKSGVNHRLRKLEKIAESKKNDEKGR